MAIQIEDARLLVYQSAYLASQHKPVGKASSMAKLFASETALAVTTMATCIAKPLDLYGLAVLLYELVFKTTQFILRF